MVCGVWRVVWALMGLKASTFKSNFPFLRGGFKRQLYNPMSLPSAGVNASTFTLKCCFPVLFLCVFQFFGDTSYFCHVSGTLDLKVDA